MMKFFLMNNKLEKTWEFKDINSLRNAMKNIEANIESKKIKAILSVNPHASIKLIKENSSVYQHYEKYSNQMSSQVIQEVDDNYVYSTHLLEVFIFDHGQVDIESCSLLDFDDEDFGSEDFEGNVQVSTIDSVDAGLSDSERKAMTFELENQLVVKKS
jgi:hypothetical protein